MDRSFLSQAPVILASRNFVCVRLSTYEDDAEADFLRTVFIGGSGQVENSTFALLTPDGRRAVHRASRSASHSYADAAALAEAMNRLADQYPARDQRQGRPLPVTCDVRLALNVAACENHPLAVLCAGDVDTTNRLVERLRGLAWDDEFIGRFDYVVAGSRAELEHVYGLNPDSGFAVLQPELFGRSGTVLAQVPAIASTTELAEALRVGLARFRFEPKHFPEHIQSGRQSGVFWDTRIPVTDPMERRARDEGRRVTSK